MGDHNSIPQELFIEILERLPVKSIIRFTSICKSWYSLITSPFFITKHLNLNLNKTNTDKLLMGVYLDSKEHYLLCSYDEKIGLGDEFLEPFKYLNGYKGRLSMVGACNGLICLGDPCFVDEPHIFVGNPSIRKLVALPIPSKPPTPQHLVVFGFGTHPTTHEYKVIRILYLMRNGYVSQIPPKTEVYTQGAASWRDITSRPQGLLMFMPPQAFVNGAIHWIGMDEKPTRGRYNLIVSFDIGVEAFSEMMLPPAVAKKLPVCFSIKVYKESLAVFCRERMCGGPYSIWVMKEYGVAESWTLLFNIDTSSVMSHMLRFSTRGEVLFSTRDTSGNHWLESYDSETKTMTTNGMNGSLIPFYVDTFMETLVFFSERTKWCLEGSIDVRT